MRKMNQFTVDLYVMAICNGSISYAAYDVNKITHKSWRNRFELRNRDMMPKWVVMTHHESICVVMSQDESWSVIMRHDDSAWVIRRTQESRLLPMTCCVLVQRIMTYHDARWLFMTHGYSWWLIMTHGDDARWLIMVSHHDSFRHHVTIT